MTPWLVSRVIQDRHSLFPNYSVLKFVVALLES